MHDHSRRTTRLRSTFIAAAMCFAATGLTGCAYYGPAYPAPYPAAPSGFDRSWDAAAGAMADNGVAIASQDRSTGTISGRRGTSEVVTNVRQQADGSVRVEINSRGNAAEDPGLIDRITASYNRRMGR